MLLCFYMVFWQDWLAYMGGRHFGHCFQGLYRPTRVLMQSLPRHERYRLKLLKNVSSTSISIPARFSLFKYKMQQYSGHKNARYTSFADDAQRHLATPSTCLKLLNVNTMKFATA